jgi:DNA mismatch repair ATPase MutL
VKGAESTDTKAPASSKMKASESNEKMPATKSAQDTKTSGEKSKSMSSETETKGAKDMKAEGRNGAMDSKSASHSKAATDSKSQTTGNAATSATAAPPAEKRTQIVSAIKTEKIQETTNVNFNISVGAVVPATVRFHPLPPRIVEIYPEWRGYQVILVHGRYVIVRPQTHEIVYIIEG